MANTTWNLPAPIGFRGLHPDLPVTVYYRHLPHWRQDGATYFVTFRLADSLPQMKLRELEGMKREWLAKIESGRTGSLSREQSEAYAQVMMQEVEGWLDQGMGECWLKRPELSQMVANDLHHGDGDGYHLGCYVTMPNHVHAIIRPLLPQEHPLEDILRGCKRHSSRKINAAVGRSGTLWQEESFDRIIRDEEHLWRCIQYIGRNPGIAGLPLEQYRLWVRPEWEQCEWRFFEA